MHNFNGVAEVCLTDCRSDVILKLDDKFSNITSNFLSLFDVICRKGQYEYSGYYTMSSTLCDIDKYHFRNLIETFKNQPIYLTIRSFKIVDHNLILEFDMPDIFKHYHNYIVVECFSKLDNINYLNVINDMYNKLLIHGYDVGSKILVENVYLITPYTKRYVLLT